MTVLDSHRVQRARKPYQCSGCEQTIETGRPYFRVATVEDGSVRVARWCSSCKP